MREIYQVVDKGVVVEHLPTSMVWKRTGKTYQIHGRIRTVTHDTGCVEFYIIHDDEETISPILIYRSMNWSPNAFIRKVMIEGNEGDKFEPLPRATVKVT